MFTHVGACGRRLRSHNSERADDEQRVFGPSTSSPVPQLSYRIGMPLVEADAGTHSDVIQFAINSQSIDLNSVQLSIKLRAGSFAIVNNGDRARNTWLD